MRQFDETVVLTERCLWSAVFLKKVCPQLCWHDFSVGTRVEKQNRFRDIGGGVISVIDWALEVSKRVQALKRNAGRGM